MPPARPTSETGWTLPAAFASRNTGCWLTGLGTVDPMAMIVWPGTTVAPATDSVLALPSEPAGSQAVPVPVLV